MNIKISADKIRELKDTFAIIKKEILDTNMNLLHKLL